MEGDPAAVAEENARRKALAIDAGGRDPERHAHLREDRASLRRRGRED